jgi:DNA-binding protein H-NS
MKNLAIISMAVWKGREGFVMPRVNLSGMTVEALMDLRKRVDEMLLGRRAELEKQLERIAVVGGARVVRGGGSSLKGRKVPPKYRSPSGETWAGRGARPVWLVAAIKGGKKLDEFLIDKSARKGRKKRRSKRWASYTSANSEKVYGIWAFAHLHLCGW